MCLKSPSYLRTPGDCSDLPLIRLLNLVIQSTMVSGRLVTVLVFPSPSGLGLLAVLNCLCVLQSTFTHEYVWSVPVPCLPVESYPYSIFVPRPDFQNLILEAWGLQFQRVHSPLQLLQGSVKKHKPFKWLYLNSS